MKQKITLLLMFLFTIIIYGQKGSYEVTSPELNIREQADKNSSILGKLANKEIVQVEEIEGNWARITFTDENGNERKGYASMKFMKSTNEEKREENFFYLVFVKYWYLTLFFVGCSIFYYIKRRFKKNKEYQRNLEQKLADERRKNNEYQEFIREAKENRTLFISSDMKQDRFNKYMQDFFGSFLSDFQKDNKGYWWKVGKNIDLWLLVGMDDGKLYFTFWSNKNNKKYDRYRLADRGYKEWLQIWQKADDESKRYFEELEGYDSMLDNRIESLAKNIHWFYVEKTYHGKTIKDIINECNN